MLLSLTFIYAIPLKTAASSNCPVEYVTFVAVPLFAFRLSSGVLLKDHDALSPLNNVDGSTSIVVYIPPLFFL